ncbi:hypothetical protein PMEGAPR54_30760 [Priestia megaterium]
MSILTAANIAPNSPFYSQLVGKVEDNILHLQDKRNVFLLDKLDARNIKSFINNSLQQPWNNHILLIMFICGDKQLDTITIKNQILAINVRLKNIFNAFHLKDMDEFRVEIHLYQYLRGIIFPEHSPNTRRELLKTYKSMAYTTKKWISSRLPIEQQAYFERFLLDLPSFNSRDFSFSKLALDARHNTRKSETDAIVDSLSHIRAEGHFRWNQLQRLRTAFLKACEEIQKAKAKLPLEFSYDEPESVGERFYFRLWDKPSFVLHHQDQFPASSLKAVQRCSGDYSPEKNHYFVEFIKAERVKDEGDIEGLWFMELFVEGVISQWYKNETEKETKRKREWLLSWGYGGENLAGNPEPFYSKHKGILTPNKFISRYQDKTDGVLFDIEPLYAATTFGLLSLDIFTTTGARLNELLQLSNTKECLKWVKVDNKEHFSFYVAPKGRHQVEPFYISEQTTKLISRVMKMLLEHYKSHKIPKVEYRDDRKHLFKELKPYFFQYHNKAFQKNTIYACLRFLLHGLRMETQEGKPVTIKPHLLRHAFATEAVQRRDMSIDIVAKILHHRNLTTTAYYSEPTPSIIGEKVDELHDIISDYIDIDEAVLRNPKELESALEEYKDKVGVFNNVIGGTCVTDRVCPIKMACLGCQAKIPQPEKKYELYEVIELSNDLEKRYKSLGLQVEVKKARMMRKQAKNELKEIELIEAYRKEQNYEPQIHFEK